MCFLKVGYKERKVQSKFYTRGNIKMFLQREQGGRMPGRGGERGGRMRTASVAHTAATTPGRSVHGPRHELGNSLLRKFPSRSPGFRAARHPESAPKT